VNLRIVSPGLAVTALAACAAVARSEVPEGRLRDMRWEDRVFLVVADGGPDRVPFKELVENPHGFLWKRRVGCAIYVEDRRFLLTTHSVVGENPLVEIFNDAGVHVVARIVASDRHLDLALLEALEDLPRTEGLQALRAAADPAQGTACMVLGSAYGQPLSASVGTLGEGVVILSAGVPVQVRRVQVPIYPGDSGGPVLDPSGVFLGIVTAAAHRGPDEAGAVLERSGEMGAEEGRSRPAATSGFVLPAGACESAWRDLRTYGRVRRGFLGVHMLPTSEEGGARVLQVLPGGPAEACGLLSGDLIISFGERPITSPRQFCALVAASKPDAQIDLRLIRGEEERLVTTRLGEAVRLPGIFRLNIQPGRPDAALAGGNEPPSN
jgi:S1-C subfamily serine protease